MKYLEGVVILTKYGEVEAVDSAVITAHQYEGNSDPVTGRFIVVSPLLGKLASSREARYGLLDGLMRESRLFVADTAHLVVDAGRAVHGMQIAERLKYIGDVPFEQTIDADHVPEASEALRQMVIKYRDITARPDMNPTTLDESCALHHGETASKLFGLMTA